MELLRKMYGVDGAELQSLLSKYDSNAEYDSDVDIIKQEWIYTKFQQNDIVKWAGHICRCRSPAVAEEERSIFELVERVTSGNFDPDDVAQYFSEELCPLSRRIFISTFFRMRGDLRATRGDYRQAARLYSEAVHAILGSSLQLPSPHFLEPQYFISLKWESKYKLGCRPFVDVIDLYNKIAQCSLARNDVVEVSWSHKLLYIYSQNQQTLEWLQEVQKAYWCQECMLSPKRLRKHHLLISPAEVCAYYAIAWSAYNTSPPEAVIEYTTVCIVCIKQTIKLTAQPKVSYGDALDI